MSNSMALNTAILNDISLSAAYLAGMGRDVNRVGSSPRGMARELRRLAQQGVAVGLPRTVTTRAMAAAASGDARVVAEAAGLLHTVAYNA